MGELFTLQPRHYRRNRGSNLHGCPIVTLAEYRSLVSRYQDSCRQADVLNASIGELWLRAYLASINYALVIAGLHVHNNGRGEHSCRTETDSEGFAGATARKLQPEEPA